MYCNIIELTKSILIQLHWLILYKWYKIRTIVFKNTVIKISDFYLNIAKWMDYWKTYSYLTPFLDLFKNAIASMKTSIMLSLTGSFKLYQLFENQVVKVSTKGWHSLKYCVNMVIICVSMVILCINKRLTISK